MSVRGRERKTITNRAQPRDDTAGWYRITDAADIEPGATPNPTNARGVETHVYLYDEIGGWGITANDFVADLMDIVSNRITLHLSSPGGSVFDGVAIYNALMDHPSRVDVLVDSVAASAASFIAQAGDSITMNRNSEMMIHNARGMAQGDSKLMREMAVLLDRQNDKIAAIYQDRAGGTLEHWLNAMGNETWYSPEEAVKAGLADRAVVDSDDDPGEPGSRFTDVKGSIAESFKYSSRAQAPDPPETPEPDPLPEESADEPPPETDPDSTAADEAAMARLRASFRPLTKVAS